MLRHVFADGQGLPILGPSKEVIEGKSVWEAFPAALSAALAPKYQAALAGTQTAFDLTVGGRTYQTQVLPIEYGGATAGMAILQDVTEQRRVEVLAELDRAKTAFLSNVSHEFRTPLTLLLGPTADALADRVSLLPPRQRERLEFIRRGGLRLHKLVNTLLDFSRIQAGHVQPMYAPTDIATLTADLASTFRSAVERAGLRLVVDCAPLGNLPQPVYLDRDMWEQIVLNLLSNALKFTFTGEITVTVRTTGRKGDGVELEVRDTGSGIPDGELPHVFDRFYRVQNAHARTDEGTGIGLALVQELVRLHGGTVRVTSELGMGSAFTVTIPTGNAHLPSDRVARREYPSDARIQPVRLSDAALFADDALGSVFDTPGVTPAPGPLSTTAAQNEYASDSQPSFDGASGQGVRQTHAEAHATPTARATILVADDNADMRAYLVRLLSEHWDVRTATDGLSALDAARSHPPDLIVADVVMPGLDGFALIAALRDNPQTLAAPVILLSARAGDEATVEGLQAGADDYLIKPFSSRELLARVQTHLELARVRKESAARAAQLDAIFEAIGDGVLVHDIERHKMRANHAQRDLQRRRLEVLGHHVDPDSLSAIPEEWERHSMIRDEHGRIIPLEEWPTERALRGETLTGANAVDEFTQGANGEILQVNVSAAPVRNASGQITGAVAVFRDVTERRQLERRVVEQASQLEAIFAAQADGVVVFDAQGRYLRANQALREIIGMDANSEYTTRSLPERLESVLLLDEQGQRFPEAQWPHSRVLRGEILAGATAMDARITTLDGRDVWVSITGAPIRGSDRRVTGAVLVTRDVTARRELERQVAEQASQLRAVFEAMTDGVFVLDTKGHITRINAAAQTFLDRAPGDSSSEDLAEARAQSLDLRDVEGRPLPLEQLPTHRLLHGEVLAGHTAPTLTIRSYDGCERIVSLTGGPLRDAAGRITGGVSVAHDITELRRTQIALAEQERLFRTLVENSPDIISRFDRDLRFLYISPASERLTGIPPQARLGKTYAELGVPETIFAPWEAALREVFAIGQPQTFESGYGTEGQMSQVSRVTYIPEFAADRSVESVLGITTDITALKQTEDALRQSEERFSTAFHASPIGLAIVSFADYRIMDVNAAETQLTGYSRDEMVGSRVAELGLIAPEGIDILREALGRDARLTEAPVFVRTKSGEMRSCLSSVERIRVGDEDCLIVTTRDVTARERAEEALKRQERQFRTLVENSPDIIARFDRQLRYLYISPAIANIAPIPPERYLGKTNQELGWPEALYAPAQRAIEKVFQTGESATLLEDDADVHDVHEARYFRAQILPELAEDGTVESALTVTTEITDLKRAEIGLREATAVAQAAQREEALRRREAERREQIAESLRDVLTILNSDRQVTKILDFITRQAGRLLSSDAAAIYTTDSDTAPGADTAAQTAAAPASRASKGALELQAAFGLSPALTSPRGKRRLSAGDAALLRAMVARKPVAVFASPPATSGRTRTNHQSAAPQHPIEPQTPAVDDISDYVEVREEALPAPYRALLAIPIVTQGHAYGSLLLLYAAPHRFSSEEVALAMAYGDQVALAVANTHLQGHIERAAAEAERNRLARDLHDTVTQEIFTASVLAESIPKVWEHHRADAEASLRQVHQLTRSALAALRAMLLELRPVVLEQKTLDDLLRQLGEVMTLRSGAPIEVAVADDCPPLPIAVKVAFYRIAQEALMNAAKYANAHTIFVHLRYLPTEEAIQLNVQDDGRGFEAGAVPAGHFGLGMMRERARAVGASLRITSRHGHGVRVAVKWAAKGSASSITQEYAAAGRARRKPIHHLE
jgi:PAS domain S-box-containing protein